MEKSSDAAINQNAEISAISKDERVWALLCHISAFACFVFPFGNIIAPLIVWVLKKVNPNLDKAALIYSMKKYPCLLNGLTSLLLLSGILKMKG